MEADAEADAGADADADAEAEAEAEAEADADADADADGSANDRGIPSPRGAKRALGEGSRAQPTRASARRSAATSTRARRRARLGRGIPLSSAYLIGGGGFGASPSFWMHDARSNRKNANAFSPCFKGVVHPEGNVSLT